MILNTNSQVQLSVFFESVYLLGLNIRFYEVKATKIKLILQILSLNV